MDYFSAYPATNPTPMGGEIIYTQPDQTGYECDN
jgi:hypothetical protein